MPEPHPEPKPELEIEPESTTTTSSRRLAAGISISLVAAWLAVAATLLLGLVKSQYSGQNWYQNLTHKELSVLGVFTIPIAMLCTTMARTGRSRLAWAAVLAGTALVPALIAVRLMVLFKVPLQELMVELIGCTVIIGLAAYLAVEGARRIAASSVRPNLVTSIVVWVLVVAAFAAFLPMRALVYWPADVAPLWVLATLGLAFPLAPRTRIAVGASVVGVMVSIALYVLSAASYVGPAPIVAGSLVIAVVAVVHLRPVYLSLRDQSSPPKSS